MKILFFGDVQSQTGRAAVAETLPVWRAQYKPDFIIANAENSSHGAGATPKVLDELLAAGVEAFTFGDHVRDTNFSKLKDYPIVRPANLAESYPGVGARVFETALHHRLLIINLLGNAFIKVPTTHYFHAADKILKEFSTSALDGILIDFHGEATSEKNALSYYLDGQVSAFVGTHTHVPTADTRLLPKGTAYQSDVGMCGALNSVIGGDIQSFQNWLRKELGETVPKAPRNEDLPLPYICDAVLIETSGATQSKSIRRLTNRPEATH